jgi:hypothetical protein
VLTLAEAALDAHRPARLIDDDHRMEAVGLAGATQILDLVAGAKCSINAQGSVPDAQCSTEPQRSMNNEL